MGSYSVFAAIDFETANTRKDGACAVGVVRVEAGRIVARAKQLLRPPKSDFIFSAVHGITWADVVGAPSFDDSWTQLSPLLSGVGFIAAHNASFDSAVLAACCAAAGLKVPPIPFLCTVRLARRAWGVFPTTLPAVCRRLHIPLRHHDPLSDAEASARIVLAAGRAIGSLFEKCVLTAAEIALTEKEGDLNAIAQQS